MKTKKQFLDTLKQCSKCYNIILHFKTHYLHVCQIIISPYFISVSSQLISISLTTSLHQVKSIMIFLGTVNAEGGMPD